MKRWQHGWPLRGHRTKNVEAEAESARHLRRRGSQPGPESGRRARSSLRGRARLLRARHAHVGADPIPVAISSAAFSRVDSSPAAKASIRRASSGFVRVVDIVVPRLLAELRSERAQARSQALHTLSKIRDAGTWPAITRSLLRDPDDDVARSAWRAAVVLVPHGQEKDLAEELASQFGRGDREVQLSLSRAFVSLGEEVIDSVLRKAMASDDPAVHTHASATERLLHEPEAGLELAIDQAKRIFALGK